MNRSELLKKLARKKSNSIDALEKFASMLPANSRVLDVGSGPEELHANVLRCNDIQVDTCDFHKTATYYGNFNEVDIPKVYDAVWSSHCLEHQLNVNSYLKKVVSVCRDDGLICVTVPPAKDLIVGGHVSLWNPGLLLYNLVLAGLDCSQAQVKRYGYNISVIVTKQTFEMPELKFIGTDLGVLRPYFPAELEWVGSEGRPKFSGKLSKIGWL